MRLRILGAFGFLFVLTATSNVCAGGFVSTGLMTEARAEHQAVLLNDGRVLIIGGGYPGGNGTYYYGDASAELYDPSTGIFTATGSMNIPRFGSTAVLLQNGKVLVYGGGETCYYCPGEIYDPATGSGTLTGSDLFRLDGFYQTGTLLDDGTVLTSGGWALQDVGVSIWAERYDPVTGEFSLVSELSTQRYSSTATLLRDGRVLIAGGDNWSDGGGGPLANVDIYDPQTKTVSPGPSMTTPRAYHTATLLKNGKVFIAGGSIEVSFGSALAHGTTEIFDPATNAFSPAGLMTDARVSHTATLLPDGQVLIAGGGNTLVDVTDPPGDAIPYAELYNPNRGRFTRIANMLYARQSHQAVLLKNGNVLITGGYDQNHNRLATAELYEPHPSPRPLAPSVTPASLNLGTVPYGTTSQPMSVMIENLRQDRRPLFIEGETTTPGFNIVQSCVEHLQPGQSCQVTLTFTPQFVASQTGTLTIFNDSSDKQQSVALSGTGGRPVYP